MLVVGRALVTRGRPAWGSAAMFLQLDQARFPDPASPQSSTTCPIAPDLLPAPVEQPDLLSRPTRGCSWPGASRRLRAYFHRARVDLSSGCARPLRSGVPNDSSRGQEAREELTGGGTDHQGYCGPCILQAGRDVGGFAERQLLVPSGPADVPTTTRPVWMPSRTASCTPRPGHRDAC